MKLTCLNDASHQEFIGTALVNQDWKLDENGNYIECLDECSQIIRRPGSSDYYNCAICGSEVSAS